jgi:hypothetical protein
MLGGDVSALVPRAVAERLARLPVDQANPGTRATT